MSSPRRTPALGTAVRQLRLEAELTLDELALRAGMHLAYVEGIERGERNPTWRSLTALAAALGVPVSTVVLRVETVAAEEEGDA